jgi:hypothetical protein
MRKFLEGAAVGPGLLAASAGLPAHADGDGGFGGNGIKHVLLISIDGMHALDFINCAQGISGVNGGNPYCPSLAELAGTGVNYLEASASQPSDSFPGLMALVSGGSPRTVGAFYDVAYDRSLDPPATTTGNGVAGAPGLCTPGAPPTGTTTEYEEGIDIDQSLLNGGAPGASLSDGGIASIDQNKLPRDPAHGCAPVYPWNFVRANTIFGVVHATGGYTAWSDKHPSYSSVSGPGKGTNVDDYYSPEINSNVVALPGVPGCSPVRDPTNGVMPPETGGTRRTEPHTPAPQPATRRTALVNPHRVSDPSPERSKSCRPAHAPSEPFQVQSYFQAPAVVSPHCAQTAA